MKYELTNENTGEVLLSQLEVADTFFQRLRGLQFRRSISCNSGLLLSPCSSLHTCFMRFSIDVIMLDADNIVLAIRRSVQPWRMLLCDPGTVKVIETGMGTVSFDVGTRLAWNQV